jgi:hypothetical protein
MSEITSARGVAGAPMQPAPAGDLDSPGGWTFDDVHIAKADGLRGSLGLYAVTTGGHTRYMNRQDADDLRNALAPRADTPADSAGPLASRSLFSIETGSPESCGGRTCVTDEQIYSKDPDAMKGAGSVPQRPAREVLGNPGTAYDVAKVTQSEIDALKGSRDDATRRLGRTIENAKTAYGDLIAKGGRIVVTTSAGNGGQPVLVAMGPGFDPKLPARVHTHYHGDNATVADPVGSKAGTNARIREVLARNPQTVFVLPEAKRRDGGSAWQVDSPQHNTHYKASWAHVRSQVQTTEDALDAAGVTHIGKEIVSVHSRGGEVIQQLMANDKSGRGLRADRLEIHDSLYGSQYAVAQWGATANGKAAGRVIYYHGTNVAGRHAVIENAFKGRFTKVEMGAQKPLDETTNPVVRGPSGETLRRTESWVDKEGNKHVSRPLVRQFHENPHYRTTGQFLDAYD